MKKTQIKHRNYSVEFKLCAILNKHNNGLNYFETVRKHWNLATTAEIACQLIPDSVSKINMQSLIFQNPFLAEYPENYGAKSPLSHLCLLRFVLLRFLTYQRYCSSQNEHTM